MLINNSLTITRGRSGPGSCYDHFGDNMYSRVYRLPTFLLVNNVYHRHRYILGLRGQWLIRKLDCRTHALAPSLKEKFEGILKSPGPGESIFECTVKGLGRDENLS